MRHVLEKIDDGDEFISFAEFSNIFEGDTILDGTIATQTQEMELAIKTTRDARTKILEAFKSMKESAAREHEKRIFTSKKLKTLQGLPVKTYLDAFNIDPNNKIRFNDFDELTKSLKSN